VTGLLHQIRSAIADAATAVIGAPPPVVPLAAPASAEMGDLASPVAMALAKAAKRPPREIAEAIATGLRDDPGTAAWLGRVEVAGPGFLNMTLTPSWFAASAARLAAEGGSYGSGTAARPEDVLLEFVSANPTGPLHVGHARQAAYGDSLARILAFAGHTVAREYYTNDFGRQMRLFGESVAARYAGLFGVERPVPEGGYNGDYVVAIAEAVREEVGDALRRGHRRLHRARRAADAGLDRGHPGALPGRLRRLVLRAHAARRRPGARGHRDAPGGR
jgi:arginyl-tRNA synthetase